MEQPKRVIYQMLISRGYTDSDQICPQCGDVLVEREIDLTLDGFPMSELERRCPSCDYSELTYDE